MLALSQIYGDAGRPTGARAIKGAIWTVGMVAVLCVWNFGLKYQRIGGADYLLEFGMLQSLPFVLPVLGLLRTPGTEPARAAQTCPLPGQPPGPPL